MALGPRFYSACASIVEWVTSNFKAYFWIVAMFFLVISFNFYIYTVNEDWKFQT